VTRYDEALAHVTTRALEEMCFFFAVSVLNDEQRDAKPDAAMSVRFVGPVAGRVVVRLCGGMLGQLAANMLGDADGSPAMQRDALGEVANVVCGNLLPLIVGPQDAFALEAAQPAVILDQGMPGPVASVQVGFETTGRADVFLFLDAA
jgi:CheY-specific phosphatase CheX